MMIEAISKILEAVAKYAWGVLVVCLFVIVLPSGPSEAMGLKMIRSDYLGFWWIGLVSSAAIWGGSLFSRLSSRFLAGRDRRAAELVVLKRLTALDRDEENWIVYCLLHNVQTLSAEIDNQTANSLLNKEIVSPGSGSPLNLSFHIKDFVWKYLLAHKDEFLPSDIHEDRKKKDAVERFAKSLTSRH